VFSLQWGIGLAIDGLRAQGFALVPAYRWAFAVYGLACALSFAWLVHGRWRAGEDGAPTPARR
jgi:hypothetical protein